MAKKIVVQGDKVSGTDTHAVGGVTAGTPPPPPPPYAGSGKYSYDGTMTAALSDFVTIAGKPVAIVSSGSSLNSPHIASAADSYDPSSPGPNPVSLSFTTAPDGTGTPSDGAGSSFVKIGGAAVLLDGDKLDTCGGEKSHGNSSVAASGQDFVAVEQ
jgi:uncharacterized Zn-binding protein involved in type VI secretion